MKPGIQTKLSPEDRLKHIAQIIEAVDDRALHADGPVPSTRHEMADEEMRAIYHLATQREDPRDIIEVVANTLEKVMKMEAPGPDPFQPDAKMIKRMARIIVANLGARGFLKLDPSQHGEAIWGWYMGVVEEIPMAKPDGRSILNVHDWIRWAKKELGYITDKEKQSET